MHWETARVKVEQWRRRIQIHLLPGGTIPCCAKPVRPRVEERDSGGAPLRGGSLEVLHPPEHLHASMAKRSTEHAVPWEENSLEIARDKFASGWVFQEV